MRILSWVRLATPAFLILGPAAGAQTSVVNTSPVTPDIAHIDVSAKPLSSQQQFKLGSAYLTGDGVQQSDKLAVFWYEKAAQAGDPDAQNDLGYLYQVGIGVPADPTRAVNWYRLASSAGLPIAKVNLGVAYLWGIGTPKDTSLAEQLFREALKKGVGVAAAYLGIMYYSGFGVTVDREQARRWYSEGVKLHNPMADYNMATHFFMGSDMSKAANLLRDSVGGGYTAAMHSLGMLLVNHPELAKSPDEGRRLLEEAAEAGNWQSAAALAVLARDGLNVPADNAAAYRYFREAALAGGESALNVVHNDLEKLTANLGTQATKKLDAEAEAWRQKHPRAVEYVVQGNRKKGFPAFSLTTPGPGVHAGAPISTFSTDGISREPM
jgi:TPR repeat protein